MEFEETGGSGRFLILGDMAQEYPQERLRVTGAEEVKGANGKPYARLTLRGEVSNIEYQMACFSRDVGACVKQWGKNPETWGFVTFEVIPGSRRRALIPAANQTPIEEQIAA